MKTMTSNRLYYGNIDTLRCHPAAALRHPAGLVSVIQPIAFGKTFTRKMFSFFVGALILSLVLSGSAQAETVQQNETSKDDMPKLQALAEKGDPVAQARLGWVYEEGNGVAIDFTKALEWYEKSAAQGNINAENNLGNMYANGKGTPQDFKKAAEWVSKAAGQGDPEAENNLGVMYMSDWGGVSKDLIKSYVWSSLAAEHGITQAGKNRDDVAKLLSVQQKNEADEALAQKKLELHSAIVH